MRILKIATILLLLGTGSCLAQTETTFGVGLGLDYGGIGGNLSVYPSKNFGLFAGAGYALAGVGFNGGLKYRFLPDASASPFIMGMYGYTTAIQVSNAEDLNKFFYGPSFGIGIDSRGRGGKRGYWSLALVVPVRGSDVDNYIAYLRTRGVSISSPSPVAFSIGYRFLLSQ